MIMAGDLCAFLIIHTDFKAGWADPKSSKKRYFCTLLITGK
jgi:hypothetical protein